MTYELTHTKTRMTKYGFVTDYETKATFTDYITMLKFAVDLAKIACTEYGGMRLTAIEFEKQLHEKRVVRIGRHYWKITTTN